MAMFVKRRVFLVLTILGATAVALLIGELAAAVYVVRREGHYVPAQKLFERPLNTFIEQLILQAKGCRYVDALIPHPYLAFVYHKTPPCGLSQVNNVGLFGHDYPLEKRDDYFVVLLTGGSVAGQLGQIDPPPKEKYLEVALNRRYASPTGKPFMVLNGGGGAWKQPQQAILYLLYADVVDAVVTLDGFNEHYYLHRNILFEYPASSFFMLNPANIRYGRLIGLWMMGRAAGAISTSGILRHSHLAYLTRMALNKAVTQMQETSGLETLISKQFELPKWDDDRKYMMAMMRYKKYIRSMDAIAKAHSARSAFFVQPAPAIQKPLTEEERKVVGDLTYRPVFERMTRDLLRLREQGVNIHSLLDLYADERETIYEDWIHPKTSGKGYRKMADRMAALLAASWSLRVK